MALTNRIESNEKFVATPYLCSEGYATIGIGANLEASPRLIAPWSETLADLVARGKLKGQPLVDALDQLEMRWTYEEARAHLDETVDLLAGIISARWPWTGRLDLVRIGVMVEMAYQLGIGGLAGFKKFLAAAQSGDWDRAANEIVDSKMARQVGDGWGGKKDRAERLAEIFKTGKENA